MYFLTGKERFILVFKFLMSWRLWLLHLCFSNKAIRRAKQTFSCAFVQCWGAWKSHFKGDKNWMDPDWSLLPQFFFFSFCANSFNLCRVSTYRAWSILMQNDHIWQQKCCPSILCRVVLIQHQLRLFEHKQPVWGHSIPFQLKSICWLAQSKTFILSFSLHQSVLLLAYFEKLFFCKEKNKLKNPLRSDRKSVV